MTRRVPIRIDGKTQLVAVPDDASDDEVIEAANEIFGPKQPLPTPQVQPQPQAPTQQAQPSRMSEFLGGLGSSVSGAVKSIPGMVQSAAEMSNPILSVYKAIASRSMSPLTSESPIAQMLGPNVSEIQKAGEFAGQGRGLEAVGSLAAGVVPGYGPRAKEIGEVGAESPSRGVGMATGDLALSMLLSKLGLPAKGGKIPSPRAVVEARLKGAPAREAALTGQVAEQEAGLAALQAKIPRLAQAAKERQAARALESVGGRVEPSEFAATAKAVRTEALRPLKEGGTTGAKAVADKAYDTLRAKVAKLPEKEIEVGQKVTTLPERYPGEPARLREMSTPVKEKLRAPFDYRPLQEELRSFVESLREVMPTHPGLGTLEKVMKRPAMIELLTAEQDLSAIKRAARGIAKDIPVLRTQAEGVAAATTGKLQKFIDQSADKVGILGDLQKARNLVRVMHEIYDRPLGRGVAQRAEAGGPILKLINTAKTRDNLIAQGGKAVVNPLRGRLFTEFIDKASPGGIFKSSKFASQWEGVAPEARRALFTPEQIERANLLSQPPAKMKQYLQSHKDKLKFSQAELKEFQEIMKETELPGKGIKGVATNYLRRRLLGILGYRQISGVLKKLGM